MTFNTPLQKKLDELDACMKTRREIGDMTAREAWGKFAERDWNWISSNIFNIYCTCQYTGVDKNCPTFWHNRTMTVEDLYKALGFTEEEEKAYYESLHECVDLFTNGRGFTRENM